MTHIIIYHLLLIVELLVVFAIACYAVGMLYSSLYGVPFVPSSQKEVEYILKEANLKKNQNFVEIGSGDGRVVRTAVQKYQVKGLGIEINPLLNLLARLISRLKQDTKTMFITKNIFKTDLSNADVVYLFLMPKLITKLLPKFNNELKKNTLVISHGFKIEGWEKLLFKKIDHAPFPTFLYRR